MSARTGTRKAPPPPPPKSKGIPVYILIILIIIIIIFAILAAYSFLKWQQCQGDALNHVCPVGNTNTTT